MYLLTNKEMKAIDKKTIEDFKIDSHVLMESAGIAIVHQLQKDFDLNQEKVLVLAGSGNNGGDGLVVARHLYIMGCDVTVFVINESGKTSVDHQKNRDILNKMPVKVYDITRSQQLKLLKAHLLKTTIVLDCLFGTGLSRPLSALFKETLHIINDRDVARIAIDAPTGYINDDDHVFFQADKTYTLAWPKIELYHPKSNAHTGEITVLPIGIPNEVADTFQLKRFLLEKSDVISAFKPYDKESYKKSHGHLGLLCGSVGMGGACILAGKSALTAGAGMITAVVDKGIFTSVAQSIPEMMVRPVQHPDFESIQWLIDRADAIVLGPGLGLNETSIKVVNFVLQNCKKSMVIDADALTIMAKEGLDKYQLRDDIILTPHPGEMARLVGMTTAEIQKNRLQVAESFSRRYGVTLILKGHHSLIAHPDGRLWLNEKDSSALATAGSGDVLAGMTGAFLANGLSPDMAACSAVYTHGLAGVRCEEKWGTRSTYAGKIIEMIGEVSGDFEHEF